jgi:hypothetical protein
VVLDMGSSPPATSRGSAQQSTSPDESDRAGRAPSNRSNVVSRPEREPSNEAKRPLPVGVFVAGAAGTTVLGALTIWSGLQATSARDKYDSDPAAYDPDEVRRLALRTDLLLAGTTVVGLATIAAGFWLVDWKGHGRATAIVTPKGGVTIAAEGHF